MDQFGEPPPVSNIPLEVLQMVPEISDFIRQESGYGLWIRHLRASVLDSRMETYLALPDGQDRAHSMARRK